MSLDVATPLKLKLNKCSLSVCIWKFETKIIYNYIYIYIYIYIYYIYTYIYTRTYVYIRTYMQVYEVGKYEKLTEKLIIAS